MKIFLFSIIFFTSYCEASDFHVILNDDNSPSSNSTSLSGELNDWFDTYIAYPLIAKSNTLDCSPSESNVTSDLPRTIDRVVRQGEIDTITATMEIYPKSETVLSKSSKPIQKYYRKDKPLSEDNLLFYSKLNINNLSKEERKNDSKEQKETRTRLNVKEMYLKQKSKK